MPPDRADTTGVSVDQRGADGRPFEQTEIACSRFRQTRAQWRAGCYNLVTILRIIVRGKIAKTHALEVVPAPALFVGEIIPFTGERTHRPCGRSGGAKRKVIGKVEEMTGRLVSRRPGPLQPQQSGKFHFRRAR